MDCGVVKELIPLMVGGDLDPDEFDRVLSHLRGCTECKQLHDEYMKTHRLVCLLGDDVNAGERPPAGFVVAVNRAIRLDREGATPNRWGAWTTDLLRAAALVLVAVGLGIVSRTLFDGGASARPDGDGTIVVVVPTPQGQARMAAVAGPDGRYYAVDARQPADVGPKVTGGQLDRAFEELNSVDLNRGAHATVRYRTVDAIDRDF